MQGLLLLLSGLGWGLDLLLFVLDLNYWLVSSVVSLLFWTLHFLLNLPGTIALGLLRCWENALVSAALLGEACGSVALGSVHAVLDGLRGLLSGLDSLQLVWNLLCHVLLRSKEMMQRGLLNVALSGQNVHRQVWEALGIAGSLVAYIANSMVNVCLIGVQNVFSAALGAWLTVVNVVLVGKDMIAALLSQISSTAVAVVILFWTPFQLAVDLLVSCSAGIGVILFRHLYEVLLLLFLIWASRLILRPSPALRSFQEILIRLGHVVQIIIHNLLNAEVWRRAAAGCLQLVRMYRAAWDRDRNRVRTRAQNTPVRVPNPAGPTWAHNPPPARVHQNATPERRQAPQRPPTPERRQAPQRPPTPERRQAPQRQPPPAPPPHASSSHGTEKAAEDPWKLLKQQEESKKCVICQDENKTILLLPCRHLCLCSECAEILLQQPILQRNCPLCRKMILQTLTVYM
ncbi:E3 ubiquitin-protein ligase RNF26 [Ranitomeya imitator]|uniref:E3 ubiquitin-protein ligase RNF26 n=1 Tax=Ranitomeya imitator TaxID=111125 RepID=UPI0037E9AE48